MKKPHGGPRPGAGRKASSKVKIKSVGLPEPVCDKVDAMRGEVSRVKFLSAKIDKMKIKS